MLPPLLPRGGGAKMWLQRALWPEGLAVQAEKNNLVMAGAVGNPVEGATFIFRNLSQEVGLNALYVEHLHT